MDTCPICGIPGPHHGALPHQVATEQAEAGYVACGCSPDEHDATGPCIRRAGHVGPCAGLDEAGRLVVATCRTDDAAPHSQTILARP